MRRHVRTVRRKRLAEVLGEVDPVGAALPGLVCGLVAIGVALFASDAGRNRRPSLETGVASASSRSASETVAHPASATRAGGRP